MKDIFIDANIANKFASPPNQHYIDFVNWLLFDDKVNPNNNAIIMISDKLVHEYTGGNNGCALSLHPTSIGVILNTCIVQGRFTKISSDDIKTFIKHGIPTNHVKLLRSNKKDWLHFPLVFFSSRKMAISEDMNFLYDLLNFPRHKKGVIVGTCPSTITYI